MDGGCSGGAWMKRFRRRPRERFEQVGEADAQVDIIDDTVPERVDRAVHQGDGHLHVGLWRSERKGLEEEHGRR